MKKYLFLILLCILLSSCSSQSDYKKLNGIWTNGSISLIFSDNNNLSVSLDKDTIPEITGSYSLNGSDIFMQFNDGKIPNDCAGESKYEYTINEIALNFDMEVDLCPMRKEEFAKTFKKIK